MTLTPGTRLSSYEILESIGAGGMGEVYKARDNKLCREVAIKVLPEAFAENKKRLERFEREARLLASLNHPNIAAIHDLQESDGVHFLVLELVPGETLAEHIKRGPIPVDEVLPLFKQIAEGLEAAHEKGVIHRDLKPANVKVTPKGKVKVLDFGLAKAMADEVSSLDASQSPTLTKDTALGAILGTAAYMSPEQARGKPVDKRADIWAFGCCLYETLTGTVAFLRATVSDTIACILDREPDWERLPEKTPPAIRILLHRCLQKDPAQRIHDIADARIEIEDTRAGPPETAEVETKKSRLSPWAMAAAMIVGALTGGLIIWSLQSQPMQDVVHLSVNVPSKAHRSRWFTTSPFAFSPDGSRFVYVAGQSNNRQLFQFMLKQPKPKAIPGTQGDQVYGPFFSPDGEWIGFFADGVLKKVMLEGDGAPVSLCEAPGMDLGGTWGQEDTLFFSNASGIWQIKASGGKAELVTEVDSANRYREPEILPNGKAMLVTIDTNGTCSVAVLSLETGELKNLIEGGSTARYASTGHLIYLRNGSILAVPFDVRTLRITGTPVPVLDDVDTQWSYGAAFALSPAGSLVYSPRQLRSLALVHRNGLVESLPQAKHAYDWIDLRVSPDGQHLATTINGDIWIYDISRDVLTRLTLHPAPDGNPVWSPDGRKIAFQSTRSGTVGLYWKSADGAGEANEILLAEDIVMLTSWSPDEKLLAFSKSAPSGETDIWLVHVGEKEPRPLFELPFKQTFARFSPDGRWMTYVSGESGEDEVYIQAYPVGGEKRQISKTGGDFPVWGPVGKELFYKEGTKLMAVSIQTEPELVIGKSRQLFDGYEGVFDVLPGGQQLVMFGGDEPQINVVLNWHQELLEKVPVK
jgi:serine/threonine protein kinase